MFIESISDTHFKQSDLVEFMRNIDDDFKPPLSSRINIEKYCEKILCNAVVMVAHESQFIFAVAAFYCNNYQNKISYLSYIGVAKEYRGNDIAKVLLCAAMNRAQKEGMQVMATNTWSENEASLRLYEKLGFVIINEIADRPDGGKNVYLSTKLDMVYQEKI